MAKNRKTTWHCLFCGYSETNYKHMDGCRCPKCCGPLIGKQANAQRKIDSFVLELRYGDEDA